VLVLATCRMMQPGKVGGQAAAKSGTDSGVNFQHALGNM